MFSPSFSAAMRQREPIRAFVLLVLSGVFFVFVWQEAPVVAVIAVLFGVIVFFSRHLAKGLFALSLVGFLIGWDIDFSRYPWARDVPYLQSLNAPVADFAAAALFLGVVLFLAAHPILLSRNHLRRILPGAFWYAAFLLAAGVSILSVYNHETGTALNYFFRFLVFSYGAFVIVPCVIIRKKETLDRALSIWLVVGVSAAVFGLSSLFIAPQDEWIRAAPYAIFGIAPLGFNHNLLAETLVAILPVAVLFSLRSRDLDARKLIGVGAGLIALTALLTLSRAAWVAILLQAVLYLRWFRPSFFGKRIGWMAPAIVCAALVAAYMAVFLGSAVVDRSNESRVEATRVSLFYARHAPLLGYGPGMYRTVLEDTEDYVRDFGDPLDAHGFVQKILVEEGVLGLVFFLGFLAFVLRRLWLAADSGSSDAVFLSRALFLSVAGSVAFQLFNTSYFNSHMWLPIGVALAAANITRDYSIT